MEFGVSSRVNCSAVIAELSPPPSYEDAVCAVNAAPPTYAKLAAPTQTNNIFASQSQYEHGQLIIPPVLGICSVPTICLYCSRFGMTLVRHKHLSKHILIGALLTAT